jgi:flagellar hook-associated protein 2
MSISSPGIGSGLDIAGIINKLMQVEQQPLIALSQKEASYQAKISAFGSLQSALSSLQSAASGMIPSATQTAAEKYMSFSASVADSTIASASASTGAVAGSYSLEVISLAKAHQMDSGTTYDSSTDAVGIVGDTITLELGSVAGGFGSGGAFSRKSGTTALTIDITAENNTLAGIRDAINSADAGISATIVTGAVGADPTVAQLVLTSKSTGTADAIRISGSVAAWNYEPSTNTGTSITTKQAPTDATAKINDVLVTSTTNTITNAATGVNLTVTKETTTPTTLTVSKNTTATLTASFTALVKAYNDLIKTSKPLGSYDAETKKGGALLGNATLRAVESKIRKALGDVPSGATGTYQRLAQVGVTLQRDGTMSVDATKLQAAISADYNSVAALAGALGSALKTTTDSLLGTGGTLPSATAGLQASIKAIDARRESMTARLVQIEARYRKQFTALDTALAGMNSTSAYLTQQLASLNFSSSK